MSVHTGLPNGRRVTVIAKAHLAVDALLWLGTSVFLHWLKRSKYPQKCTQHSELPFFLQRNDECILFCQSWGTSDIQSEAKDKKERAFLWTTLASSPHTQGIKIKLWKREKIIYRDASQKSKKWPSFSRVGVQGYTLEAYFCEILEGQVTADQTLPTPPGVRLFVKKYRHMSSVQTGIVSELRWRQESTCPCYLVFSLWLLKFPVAFACLRVCAVRWWFF